LAEPLDIRGSAHKAAFLGIGILATVAIACNSGTTSPDPGTETQFPDDPLSAGAISQIVGPMLANREVADARVNYDNGDFSLELIVDCAITDERIAKSLGTQIVKRVKIFSGKPRPKGSVLGTGDFDYQVDVSCRDGSNIARGAKVSNSPEITWQHALGSQTNSLR
jgi:hypothetical protein